MICDKKVQIKSPLKCVYKIMTKFEYRKKNLKRNLKNYNLILAFLEKERDITLEALQQLFLAHGDGHALF